MPRQEPGATRQVLVWDLPTRAFHWLLAGLVVVAFVSGKRGHMDVHFIVGYAILTLVLFRLIWGVIGSRTARFADFVRGPGAMLAYVRGLRGDGAEPPALGHNPLGGAMVVVMLALLLAQATTGLFTTDDIFTDGPLVGLVSASLVKTLSTVHRVAIDALVILVALHVAAIALYRVVKGENLVLPMLTGRKAVAADRVVDPPRRTPAVVALLALAVAAAVVAAVVNLAG
ncbi:cytochrome b/b6 domain-containing protein [Azospirillum halopraeferens]|uniref:cytochrome b/b6 domain-containing protein n=1 Tax=Azospirillum halopraeferens TaxID=34010 RepID=UPI00041C4FDE|nr:cytochrome b/b6 domain-containing protein [Azospirillum halopraeferens]